MTELERLRMEVRDAMADCYDREDEADVAIDAAFDRFEAAVRADERAKYLADSGGRNQTHATGAGYRDE